MITVNDVLDTFPGSAVVGGPPPVVPPDQWDIGRVRLAQIRAEVEKNQAALNFLGDMEKVKKESVAAW